MWEQVVGVGGTATLTRVDVLTHENAIASLSYAYIHNQIVLFRWFIFVEHDGPLVGCQYLIP
jgi:hypothetical protein